ncbi:MAG: DUF1080 domain-containing protein [Candidatus Hydrogenedentes bacterium]|nr:DUF1080 domain-containing protein [Candidatus Hydrogenedentota bacterium]
MKMRHAILATSLTLLIALSSRAAGPEPFLGRWALTIPGGGAGWLGISKDRGFLEANILWGGGSVVPCDSAYIDGDTLVVTRTDDVERKDAAGTVIATQRFTKTLRATVSGDTLKCTIAEPNTDGSGVRSAEFAGKRIADLPAAPDLSKIKFGKPITLFNGKDLSGWKLTSDGQVNGWSVKDGLLVNNPAQEEGKPHKSYGNLRTEKEFEDFNFKCDVLVGPKGNSGIYLRGIYEVQVSDTYGQPLDAHNMGGIYSRITPTTAAEKPAGEWQTYDITLCDRHITVVLNGKKIIDNQPLLGCTGGALWSDEFKPGPIYLQGDHTGISYRNIVLTPIEK